ncbi:MAG: glutamate--tRNA ligase [Candidatus Moraniibacteriota bacterium]|nr:MAG: glutamate--tRNA ligase [Candidatus Moranbacteria bacterium]
MEKTVITRFAPSPTGYLHIGGLRTALYSYLYAKHTGGMFFLRIEDTDRTRYVEGAEEKLKDSLSWANIHWENKEDIRQSERLPLYKKYIDELLEKKKAYHCFCSQERLLEMREDQKKYKMAPKYDRHCLNLSSEEIADRLKRGDTFVVRFFIPQDERRIEFRDLVRGKVSIETELLDDQIILKSDGFPTYHLANIVDDHEMGVTHVIRGEEWLSSTPKHILLYKAFGWEIPEFAHLPLLLNPDRSKLSKRQGDVSVEDYAQKGYLPEALINYVALLGWNPGSGSTQEFFSLEELEKRFDIAHINKAGAVFDCKRLDWMNAHYIKKLSREELLEKTRKYWKVFFKKHTLEEDDFSDEFLCRVLRVEQERLFTLSQVGEKSLFFFQNFDMDKELLRWKDMEDSIISNNIQTAISYLETINEDQWTMEFLQAGLMDQCEKEKRGEFFWPLRIALTGEKQSPPPHEVAWVIGKEETLQRLKRAKEKL